MDELPSLNPQEEGPSSRAQELLADCLKLPTDARDQAIERLCQEHPDLADTLRKAYAFVRDLGLAEHTELPALDEDPVAQPGVDTIEIEGLRILERLGSGGMGDVWLAEQFEPVRRKVAVKLTQRGMASHRILARFEVERQALARMGHPCIAQVFGAGVTLAGAPYFLMEYVPGIPFHDYCDREHLNVDERLNLFTQVAEGVQHAHRRGIIHRDLKPSNVLVVEHQGKPIPKIIDFGIAKATEEEPRDEGVQTEYGVVIGTPEYMSPEQAAGDPEDIDTRTDVYALGVMLYELLTGCLPFESKELRKHQPLELARMLRETPPPKPSTRIGSNNGNAARLARHRRTNPASLARKIRGELDWITMMALERNRERRYESPAALAADIERYRKHEPLFAGPPSAFYRMGKFVRRYRGRVTSAALVFVTAVVGAVVAWMYALDAKEQEVFAKTQAGIANQERANAQAEARKATTAAVRAETVVALLQEMLGGSNPYMHKGKDYTVRQLLEDFDRDYRDELAEQPEVEASVQRVVGRAYLSLGLLDKAEQYLTASFAKVKGLYGPKSPEFAQVLEDRAQLRHDRGDYKGALADLERAAQLLDGVQAAHNAQLRAEELWHLGRDKEAERIVHGALAVYERHGLSDSEDYSACLTTQAKVLGELANFKQAKALHEQVLARQRARYGDRHPKVATALLHMARVHRLRDAYEDAKRLGQEAVEIAKETYGPRHLAVFRLQANLAETLGKCGQLKEGETLLKKVIAGYRELAGERNPVAAEYQLDLAVIVYRSGREADAEQLYRHALRDLEAGFGENHPLVARALAELAATLQGRVRECHKAETLLRRALKIQERVMDAQHPGIPDTKVKLAGVLALQGKLAEASQLLKQVYEAQRGLQSRRLGKDFDLEHVRLMLAAQHEIKSGILLMRRKFAEAEPHCRAMVEIYRDHLGPRSPKLAYALMILGTILRFQEKHRDAESVFREAESVVRGTPEQRVLLARVLSMSALNLMALQRWAAAENLLREALANFSNVKHREVSLARFALARALHHQDGKLAEAEAIAERALEEWNLPEIDINTMGVVSTLADILRDAGKHDRAMALYERSISIVRELRLPEAESSSHLARLGSYLLEREQYAKAEPLLRECLEVRSKAMPGSWLQYSAMSLLGKALCGLGKYSEAEPLLLEGYEKMQPPEHAANRKLDALKRLIRHYEITGKKSEVMKWRSKIEIHTKKKEPSTK